MNIIVPINLAALRVSPSTLQKAKPALYDFTTLGQSPLSSGNNLIAADRFQQAEEQINRQPGIHLHWSMPKAYAQGIQSNTDGIIRFPALPNRWLVTRFYRNANGITNVTSWILEADAHASDPASLGGSPTAFPWRDSETPQGLNYRYLGRRILLTSSWTEPANIKSGGFSYLGSLLNAPFSYGIAFAAYYRNCRNVFGIHDDFSDIFTNSNQLELNSKFTVSYSVIGWVNQTENDIVNSVLTEADALYKKMPFKDRPPLAEYLRETIEDRLNWSLDDYSSLQTTSAQGILSGMISGIPWDIAAPGNPTYPTTLPDGKQVTVAIGNNNPEALSAYLNYAETRADNNESDTTSPSIEWLLNALQFDRLSSLGDGELSAGQLNEYLHARAFGSSSGGYRWSVRNKMTPGEKAAPKESFEVTLPLSLAKLLSELNRVQQQFDSTNDEIFTRQQKAFFDWCYHMNALETHVIQGNEPLSQDISKDYLLDGIMQIFPCLMRNGIRGKIVPTNSGYLYSPAQFRMATSAMAPKLAAYIFNKQANANAGSTATTLLEFFHLYAGTIPAELEALRGELLAARVALKDASSGGTTADSYTSRTIAGIQNALPLAQKLIGNFEKGIQTGSSLAEINARIDTAVADCKLLTDPENGVFAKYLAVISVDAVPTPPGQIYKGTMKSFAAFSNASAWDATSGFQGMGDLIDELAGQGHYQPPLFDTLLAATLVATAYFWRNSGETATHSTPYYLQMALQEVLDAQQDAQDAGTALRQALVALRSGPASAIAEALKKLSSDSLPALLSALSGNAPDLASVLTSLDAILGIHSTSKLPTSVQGLSEAVLSDSYKSFVASIETAWQKVLHRLPVAQQVSLMSLFLGSQLKGSYQLDSVPASPYWHPTEPVLLLAENTEAGTFIRPVNRNGHVALLPCRLESELIKTSSPIQWPALISNLATNLNLNISGLSAILQQLVQEAFLLCPEFTALPAEILQKSALENRDLHFDKFDRVELSQPPDGFSGQLPYYIAWNWSTGKDDFLPLYIFWQAEYVYSQQISSSNAALLPSYLDAFQMDTSLAGYQPNAGTIAQFQKSTGSPNYFSLHGIATLSSASTANVCEQIRKYCITEFNYDPTTGPPPADANHDELQIFFKAYFKFRTLSVLSQGLGGFNAGLLQRSQELQLPLNVPTSWTDPSGNNLPQSAFWPTQLLFDQSADWQSAWASLAINFQAFAQGDTAVQFNPLRSGFLQLTEATLVDVFGRFIELPLANPQAVAESLQSEIPSPISDHPVYLPPRIVQPSRILARWISAGSPDGLADFTEWNPHPAASPILGWLMPNHLDQSLMFYDSDGSPLGSLRRIEKELHWFTLPGEAYTPGIDNRTLMQRDLTERHANNQFRSFLEAFALPAQMSGAKENFELFLSVIDKAQQFIITKSLQEDQALAVLIGQPLVLARCSIQIQLKGLPYVSLDNRTYMPWNQAGIQFQMDGQGFTPYNFGNFNNGGITDLRLPIRIGPVEYSGNGQSTPDFDDGLVGFFLNDDYGTLYTPVNVPDAYRIQSTQRKLENIVQLVPNGEPLVATLLLDPRAAIHLSSGLLPMETFRIPSDQYLFALNRLLATFLTAPILKNDADFHLPVPAEPGYEWNWWQVGQSAAQAVTSSQTNTVLPNSPQTIIDGWLSLKKTLS